MIEINFMLILALGIVSMIIGYVWYGVLFAKKWMHLIGVDPNDELAVQEMGKGMGPTYLLQFLLTLLMVFVIYVYTKPAADVMNEVSGALWLFAGIVVPVLASTLMWSGEHKKAAITRFLIQAGYLLVLFVVVGFAVMRWG